jgi:Outer membrane protein beta-barrel domain
MMISDTLKCGYMKNKSSIIYFVIILFCFQFKNSEAQFIDNKIYIYAGYLNSNFEGKEVIEENSFMFPSFYSNLNKTYGFSAKATYSFHKYISIGLGFENLNGSNWEYEGFEEYANATTNIFSISPIIQFHNDFKFSGIFNKLRFTFELSPTIGWSSLSLQNQIITVQTTSDSIIHPTQSNNQFFGLNGALGVEYSFNQSYGIFANYSYHYNWIEATLYNDSHFSFTQLNFGLIIRFKKDKRYLYY